MKKGIGLIKDSLPKQQPEASLYQLLKFRTLNIQQRQ